MSRGSNTLWAIAAVKLGSFRLAHNQDGDTALYENFNEAAQVADELKSKRQDIKFIPMLIDIPSDISDIYLG